MAAGIRLNVTATCQDNVSCINGAPQNVDPDYFITVAIYKAEGEGCVTRVTRVKVAKFKGNGEAGENNR